MKLKVKTLSNKFEKSINTYVRKKRLDQEIGYPSDGGLRFNFLSEEDGEALEIITDILIPQEENKDYVKIAEAIDSKISDKKPSDAGLF